MKPNNKTIMVCLAFCALLSSQTSAADLLVKNGGFESPLVNGSIPDWTVNPQTGAVRIAPTKVGQPAPPGSSWCVEMTKASISQNLIIPQTGEYVLSFYYVAKYTGNNGVNPIHNDGNNLTVQLHGEKTLSASDVWQYYASEKPLSLTAGNLDLTFTALEGGGKTIALDNICLTAVPEPYQYGLTSVFSLFGLAAFDRIRQRRLYR